MEYIFGTGDSLETLETIGHAHTDFKGFLSTSREHGGVTVIDRCRILDHFKSEEDAEGTCYDWYTITDHYRYEDRQEASSVSDSALAELSQIIGSHEMAIAELSELVSEILEGGK